MKQIRWSILLIVSFLGVAASASDDTRKTDGALVDSQPYVLEACFAYYRAGPGKSDLDATVKKLGRFDRWEWYLIQQRMIQVGIRKEVLACAYGRPMLVRRAKRSWGLHEQWIYPSPFYGQYVYLRNGRVTAWQDW
ncbi:hypothetical protein MIT9_P0875 [Methylomarinovum caldicuralii]|uniref:Lipoprotein n=1 Tax=Methylomarinovum caldicuralii TaxID=438856 RepID=A0AAU9CP38_9GAMM|nr:hypothetical protein [Methylomarinovum caldicuralii]BCX81297.1 hypothetical protein MIT9_P0875 [Methylomarinovum caldicuralii]